MEEGERVGAGGYRGGDGVGRGVRGKRYSESEAEGETEAGREWNARRAGVGAAVLPAADFLRSCVRFARGIEVVESRCGVDASFFRFGRPKWSEETRLIECYFWSREWE